MCTRLLRATNLLSSLYHNLLPVSLPRSYDLDNCDVQIKPAFLRALYVLEYIPSAASHNSLSILEYTPQAYRPRNLDMIAANFSSIGPSLKGEGAQPVFQAVDGDGARLDQSLTSFKILNKVGFVCEVIAYIRIHDLDTFKFTKSPEGAAQLIGTILRAAGMACVESRGTRCSVQENVDSQRLWAIPQCARETKATAQRGCLGRCGAACMDAMAASRHHTSVVSSRNGCPLFGLNKPGSVNAHFRVCEAT
ncbi:hypothetical protein C8R44DRAFT_886048 [Mycena epipterygia]|nr:hypothetical protein C8R44DRAFT_886048 [Mycena epipterygia]